MHWKSIIRQLPAVSLLLATACSPVLHDPAPSLTPLRTPWLVHCETAESHLPDEEAAPGVRHARWIWAADSLGDPIELDGMLEDGFLVMSSGSEPEVGAARLRSLEDIRRACLDTLRARNPEQPLELGKVRAARQGEEIDVPIVFLPAAPPTHPVRRMVVFGDSLSDTGRLKRRLHVFPESPYWLGRFSNGPNWVDYLAASSGLSIQNHAYGGAVVTLHRDAPVEEWLARIRQSGQLLVTGSLERQIDDYLERNLGGGRVQRADRTAFVIWAGANDYISKEPFTGEITTFLNSPTDAEGYRHAVDQVIAAIGVQVRRLHRAGARRFLVIGLPDLGKTPIVLQNTTYFPPKPPRSDEARKLELSKRLSALTSYHNQQLLALIVRLADELPDSHLLHQDAAAPIEAMLSERSEFEYGFDLTRNRATLAHGELSLSLQQRCYRGGYLGYSDPAAVCGNADRALFWDVVHPTSYTHCWVARFIGQTLSAAGWIAPLVPVEEYRSWCEQVASGERGRRETAWRLSGL